MEPRQLLSITPAAIQVGATYFEDSNDFDQPGILQGTTTPVADLLQVGFTGGAAGTQLTELRINPLGTFVDTSAATPGAYGSFPLEILSHQGFDVTGVSVADGGQTLVFSLNGFEAGEKLVFSVDVDEQGNLQPNAVVEGAEWEGATFTAAFTAPHMQDATLSGTTFFDMYALSGTGLENLLPNDNYDNAAALAYVPEVCSPGPVYTAGGHGSLQQSPLPITLSGTVYEDSNVDNRLESGEPGIPGVRLSLQELVGETYVDTGRTTTTDALGKYKFTDLLPGTYRVVETQPGGYLSVGAQAGTVGGATRGAVTNEDVLSGINLDGGDDSVQNNFGETRPAQLSGHVYHDRNNNGVMESGEEGIANVHLVVENLATHSTTNATTDATGFWSVGGLMPGQYKVAESQPLDPVKYLDGLDAPGNAGGAAHNPGDLIDGILLVGGQSGVSYDFGELLPSCLSGYAYVDSNNNGIFDGGESPIAGVTVTLLDAAGKATGDTRVTDEKGFYRFCGLAPGLYGVVETQPTDRNYVDGLDTAGTSGGTAHNPGDRIDAIPITSGTPSQQNNFGEILPASISGQVHAELNGDCIIDPNEPLLAGVTIYLLDSSGGRIKSTTTDSAGKYAFTGLMPGDYGVEEIQPAAYLQGDDHVGSASGVLNGPDMILKAQLGAGVDGVHYDFCELVPAKISGYVFQDGPTIVVKQGDPAPNIPALRDGKLTPDDMRLAGVLLTLCDGDGIPMADAGGNPITAVTDANGYYEFTMLRPGGYSIIETQPSGYVPGLDTAGSNGGLVVNSYAALDPSILGTLSVDPDGSAIVRIEINPGDVAVQYNFSEVLIQSKPPEFPPYFPPEPPSPPLPSPMALPFVEYRPVGVPYYGAPQVVMQPIFGGSGGPGGYSWHLSVIDAGQPRREAADGDYAQYPQNTIFDPVSWSGPDLRQSQFILADQDGKPTQTLRFGIPGATPVAGDWDGSGTSKIGIFTGGIWFLDINGNGVWDEGDLWVKLGTKDDQAVAGDWNGDGKTDVGIFGPAWIGDAKAVAVEPGLPDSQNPPAKIRPKNVPPDAADAAVGWRTLKKGQVGKLRSDLIDHVFKYGTKGDISVTGDWNGDGIYTVGIFRGGTWFLDMDGDGKWSEGDVMVEYGQAGDMPVVGDWNGDGISKLGVYRDGEFVLDTNNNRQIDAADKVFQLGRAGDRPVAGDWNGDGIDEVGVYENAAAPDVPLQASRQ